MFEGVSHLLYEGGATVPVVMAVPQAFFCGLGWPVRRRVSGRMLLKCGAGFLPVLHAWGLCWEVEAS